jgi:3'-5' exoribonuclease
MHVGDAVSAIFLVAEAKRAVDRRGQDYYSLVLNCPGGARVDAKVWADNIGEPIEAGKGIDALARVDEYLGNIQLNVQRYRILSPEDFKASDYVRFTEIDVDEAFETMFNWRGSEFKNPGFKKLMLEFHGAESFSREFKLAPGASKHHHNYQGGLIEHTFDVWKLADKLCEHYAGRFDRDMLMCGAALHDIGKVKSYSLAAGVSEQTDTGHLLNHVFVSASMVSNVWDRVLGQEGKGKGGDAAARDKMLVLHIILSHHGRLEWGAAVLPQIPEAILLHYCDQMSASIWSSFEAIATRPKSENWTDWLSIMDERRRIFVPPEE